MKKIFAILTLFAVLVTLSACSTKLAGKTFKYEEVEIAWTDSVSEDTADRIESAIDLLYTGSKLTFAAEDEGSLWTQDGSDVTLAGVTYTVRGDELYKSVTIEELEEESAILRALNLSEYVKSIKVVYELID